MKGAFILGKNLYITEKPSVASSFGEVLGITLSKEDRKKGYAENHESIVTWCFGHLITLALPDEYDEKYKRWRTEDLPIIPETYAYKVIDDSGVKKQFETIKGLMGRSDVDLIYSCTDSGREGEYIFRLVYEHATCNKPAKRVWISSYTDESIKDGILRAKDISEYDSLSLSAYSRAKEDWLFGMNFSRIYTVQFSWKLKEYLHQQKKPVIAVGRVMTCVLGLIVDREKEIRHFIPKKHYGIVGNFLSHESQVAYLGKWTPKKTDNKDSEEERYLSHEDALSIVEGLKGKSGLIKNLEIKTKNEPSPLLFNLAELQSEANKKYKIPVDKTLEIAQTLYERKLITYPRTDSKYLSTSIVPELPQILNGLSKHPLFKDSIYQIKGFGALKVTKTNKRYVDDSKVTDHYAIIPTYVYADISKFDGNTEKIYHLIVKRFLAIFYPPAVFNTVKVETSVGNEIFSTHSKTLKDPGWRMVYDVTTKEDDETSKSPLHLLKKKKNVEVEEFTIEEKETKPPPKYTDGSLIITMEKAGKFIENEELREQIKTCGIGTSATRASIIKKLEDIQYIKIHPKTQVVSPTPKGEAIVEIIRLTAKELLNPALSASWEKGLVMIENKETTGDIFYEKLYHYILKTIDKVKKASKSIDLNKISTDNVYNKPSI
jgi:DNA topoisomerase-3